MPVMRDGDNTVVILSPRGPFPEEVVIELTPFTDDDPMVVAAEEMMRQQLGGEPE